MALYVGGTAIGATATEINNALDGMAQGDIVYASAADTPAQLTKGTDDYVLTMNGNVPNWEAAGGASFDAAITINDSGNNADFRVEASGEENALFVQGSDGNVGIGTTSPVYKLEIVDSGQAKMGLTRINTGISFGTDHNLGKIHFGGQDSDSGLNSAAALVSANADFPWTSTSHPTRIAFYTTAENTTSLVERMRIYHSGNVGIGTTQPDRTLDILTTSGAASLRLLSDDRTAPYIDLARDQDTGYGSRRLEGGSNFTFQYTSNLYSSIATHMTIDSNGNIGAPTGTGIYNSSDSRLKENVVNLSGSLDKINQLQGVSFNWIDGFCEAEDDKTLYGFIAQDVKVIDEDLVNDFASELVIDGTTIDKPLRVEDKFIIPMLVEAIKELSAKVEALENA